MSKKVILLGLDGVAWDLIDPWIEEGELPTFKKLERNYAHGTLKSAVMPLTFIAWPSMFTGKNPGKHNVSSFSKFINRDYTRGNYNCSKDVKSKFLWEILEEQGVKCGLIDIPLSSPFRSKITFGEGDKFRKDWMNFSWPEDTRPGVIPSNKNFGRRINEIVDLRFDQLEYILENRKFDFLAMDLSSIDPLQHFKWHEKKVLKETLKKIDFRLSNFLKKLDEETYFFLVSDHGMTKLEKWFRINNWLEKKGYLKFKEKEVKAPKLAKLGINKSNFELIFNPLISLLIKFKLKRFIPRKFVKAFQKVRQEKLPEKNEIPSEKLEKLDGLIDWKNTQVYSLGGVGAFVNLEGREGQGSVPKKEYGIVREKVIKDLKEEFGGEIEIFKREEIYEGGFVENAPDIMVLIKGGAIWVSENYDPTKSLFKFPQPGKTLTATHSLYGIFQCSGKDFKKGNVAMKIYDITPTILHIFNLPIPRDIDGRVLKEIFREDSEPGKREIRYEEPRLGGKVKGIINELNLDNIMEND